MWRKKEYVYYFCSNVGLPQNYGYQDFDVEMSNFSVT